MNNETKTERGAKGMSLVDEIIESLKNEPGEWELQHDSCLIHKTFYISIRDNGEIYNDGWNDMKNPQLTWLKKRKIKKAMKPLVKQYLEQRTPKHINEFCLRPRNEQRD